MCCPVCSCLGSRAWGFRLRDRLQLLHAISDALYLGPHITPARAARILIKAPISTSGYNNLSYRDPKKATRTSYV